MPLWKRLQLPYVLALFVLLPLAMGVPWWLERRTMLERGAMPPEAELVSGTTATLAGSDWEFRGAVFGETGGAPLPKGLELVDAVFKVTPSDERASELLLSCQFRAVDDQGRSWDPTVEFSGRPLPEDVGSVVSGCTNAGGDPIPAGEETGLVVSYLVPKDAAKKLSFEVGAKTSTDAEKPRPGVLLFEQQD
ncbi:MAG: hypothetical protein M0026_09785 [Nocardiopsaceae bacterium]|nr:hypothetical protein [Nocardiopsaceae bacterium]